MKMQRLSFASSGLTSLALWVCACVPAPTPIENGKITMTVDDNLRTSISFEGKRITEPTPTEYLQLTESKAELFDLTETASSASTFTFTGVNQGLGLQKTLTVSIPEGVKDLLLMQVTYKNTSEKDLPVTAWVNNAYALAGASDPPFWAFQGSSSGERADWITPITPGYYKKNYMGMNSSDYGGGIPVTDLWSQEFGITIGLASATPELVSLPTEMKNYASSATISIENSFDYPFYLPAGESITTLETFVGVHTGDYYQGLQNYAKLMGSKGVVPAPSEPAAYEPIWCAWGYERDFTLAEVIGTLPKVKELGIKWAVLDDGFQQAEGDWHTNPLKFPKGDQQMKDFVKTIHSFGLKAKLWWAPLSADPGSKLLKENPDMRLYLSDWAPQYITWWDAYYLAPTHPKTKAHTEEIVNLFLNEWDFDGLKMDGQHMNAVAPDHNPASGLDSPEDAPKRLPEFFKFIYDVARSIKPEAVVENCPCGTCMSFFNMPYMNQAVASDPLSSWQVRLKGKTYKALIPNTAYYGDHVELSDNGSDFASSFGVGAVLGTKFTWPANNPTGGDYLLTPEKEVIWKKWFALYNQKMLSTGDYLGSLYDLGYDKPETHVVLKSDTLHYALYAPNWSGPVEFRGLDANGNYEVHDYFKDKILGEITSEKPALDLNFEQFLLLEVYKKP